ncbi:MAG: Nif3-like dinuclear metal center hexameric protein [Selenomonadaceae bacterium]|nr:Nif3-like dinuclear metal center hexameric protein [Selenomonadaceae bacterium]MBQ1915085.1 Nif3-like dinuclear metal center hexameric protein [Selenomonadaceae bacterium]
MVKCQMVMDAMERIAPRHLAEEWDNPGLLVGSPLQEIHRILVCLDVSDDVVEHAIEMGAGMIVSHHPLIFKPLKKLRTDLPLGHRLQMLLKNDIAVFSAHTNLDIAEGGVNDVLAEKIGLTETEPFVVLSKDGDVLGSMGRIGRFPKALTVQEFALAVRDALPVSHVRLVSAGNRMIRKVALCSGSGAEFILKAAALGADAYVTGDVRYHDAQHALENGMHVIDAGHFGTEFPMVAALGARLKKELAEMKGTVEILEDNASEDFFTVL